MARFHYTRMCPLTRATCSESMCAWYIGPNETGDCSIHVLGIRHKLLLIDGTQAGEVHSRLSAFLRKRDKEEREKILQGLRTTIDKYLKRESP